MLPFTKNAQHLEIGARSQEHIVAINVHAKQFTCSKGVNYNAIRVSLTVIGSNGTRFINVFLPFEKSEHHIRRVNDYLYQYFKFTKCKINELVKSNILKIKCLKRDVLAFCPTIHTYTLNDCNVCIWSHIGAYKFNIAHDNSVIFDSIDVTIKACKKSAKNVIKQYLKGIK